MPHAAFPPKRRFWITRSLICLGLGGVSTWLVAWALTAALWAGWWQPAVVRMQGLGISDSWVVEIEAGRTGQVAVGNWDLSSVHAKNEFGLIEGRYQNMADEAGIRKFIKGRLDEIHKQINDRDPTDPTPTPTTPTTPPMHKRIDTEAAAFSRTPVAQLVETGRANMEVQSIGWPWRSLMFVTKLEINNPKKWKRHWQINTGLRNHAQRTTEFWKIQENDDLLLLPLRPIWPGFALDTTVLAGLWALPVIGWPMVRLRRRKRRGLCLACGYDLTGTPDSCPECGSG
jgi:hypothetical protein